MRASFLLRSAGCGAVVMSLALATSAHADVVTINSTAFGYGYDGYIGNPYDGVFDRLFDFSPPIVQIAQGSNNSIAFEARGAWEFSLATLPAGASITSITLRYFVTDSNNNGVLLHGYSGDGVITLADMTRLNPLVNNIPAGLFQNQQVDVTNFVLGLQAQNATHAGFLLQATNATPQGSYFGTTIPSLQVTYTVPAPAAGAAACTLGLLSLRRSRRR